MKKILIYIFLNFHLFIYINNTLNGPYDTSTEMILFNKKFIYLNNKSNELYITEKDNDSDDKLINSSPLIKNKFLIQINETFFVLFGLDNQNNFGWNIYNLNGNLIKQDVFDIYFRYPIDYTIKKINENDEYLFYFFNNTGFYLYNLNLLNNKKGGYKTLIIDNGFVLNTIDCDSFDGKYIFCTYSIIKKDKDVYILKSYYSFENIENNNIGKNELVNNAAGPSLIKIEKKGQKRFYVYHAEIKTDPSIYCQSFIQEENIVHKEELFLIGQAIGRDLNYKQFYKKNTFIIKKYKYSIYILVLLKESSSSEDSITILYISTLDFNLIIPVTLEQDARTKEKKNLLINDYYFVALKYKPDGGEIEIFINEFNIQCDSKEMFEISDKEELSIKDNIIKDPNYKNEIEKDYTYVSFSLDILSHLLVDGSRNMGQLLNKIEIYYDKPNKIILEENLS